jgi:hypothetical protein
MGNRSSWWASVTSTFVVAVLLAGIAVPCALAKPKEKAVPPGQPFQALQRQIDDLDARVDALESLAGLMWINTLDSRAGTSTLALDPAGPGLLVAGAAAGDDVLQVGLQVPLGFAITGVKVCYVSGAAGAFINNVSLLQYDTPVPLAALPVLTEGFTDPGANELSCIDTTGAVSLDPSSGGSVYLSLGIAFPAGDVIAVRAIGIQLGPVAP